MLIIDKNSWHYRLRGKVFTSKPKDLCSYFWSCIAAALGLAFLAIGKFFAFLLRPLGGFGRWLAFHGDKIAIFILFLLICGIIGVYVLSIVDDPWNALLIPLFLLAIALGLGLIILALAGIFELFERHQMKSNKHLAATDKPPRDPRSHTTMSLFWAFLKAKKRKACPLIEVVGWHDFENSPEEQHERTTS